MPIPSLRPNFAPQIQAELERLYADALQTDPDVRRAAQAFGLINESDPGFYEAMSQAYLPVTPDFGSLLYMIVRMTRARSVVEFGMSFGISTIHLAAALQDLGSGKVIATEFIPAKADQARCNLAAAGLDEWVEIRVGDARDSLRLELPDQIDVLFLDGPKHQYFEVLKLLEPRLASGGIVVSDNSEMKGAENYMSYIRTPENGFIGCSIDTSVMDYHLRHEIIIKR